ncbi:MAG TPA: MFS transporter, partial [Vineibacter sp.]|nr:MFS transporter [Vineibacter sp.]
PVTADLGFSREVFGLAVGIQNLVWGLTQPFAGLVADRIGARWVVVGTGGCYAFGLGLAAMASDGALFILGLGILVGLGQSGTTYAVILALIGRLVPDAQRSRYLGVASAAGSVGMFAMVPATSVLLDRVDWRTTFVILAAVAASMSLLGLGLAEGRRPHGVGGGAAPIGSAFTTAIADRDYWLLNLGFASCGFQLAFIATYLPTILTDGALSVAIAAAVLACIGAFNIPGTYLAGLAGVRQPKARVLAAVYIARAAVVLGFLALPPSAPSAIIFAALIGLLWTGVVPLTSGLVADLWGRRELGFLFGIAFIGHQIGAFAGAWAGGFVFDRTGSYTLMWAAVVGLSLSAAAFHLMVRERPRPCALEAAGDD